MEDTMSDRATAGDVMHTDLMEVRPDTPLREVARRMIALDLDYVPVVDDTGQLIGVLTVADLAVLTKEPRPTPKVPGGHYLG
jgi:Mg/Co/Ni transporter MgtE